MTTESKITKLLSVSPGTLAIIDTLLEGIQIEADPGDRHLYNLSDAVQESNVIRTTVLLSARKKGAVWQFVFRFKSALAVRHTVMVAYLVWRLILAILTCFLR